MPVVAQVSDLHLSPRVPERQTQAELVLAGINAAKPDLTVVTGDLTDDGWDRPDDLVWAKQWMDERLDGEWFAVPGNHDVGNFVSMEHGPVNQARIDAWNQVFVSAPIYNDKTWLIRGSNSMVVGSTLKPYPHSATVDEHKYTKVAKYQAWFLHSPHFIKQPDEPSSAEIEYWLGPTMEGRVACEELWVANDTIDEYRLISSGHLHQTRLTTYRETHIVWAPPASGTWVHAPGLPNPPAPERTGFVLHHLGDNGSVRSEVVECAPMLKTVFFDPSGRSE